MIRRCLPFPILAVLALAGVVACDSPSDVEMGRLSIMLTDAPGDVLEAWVTIENVEVRARGEEEEVESEEPAEPTELMSEPMTVDLLTLVDQMATLVSGASVEAGSYRQVRFVIPAACIVVEGAEENEVYSSDPEYLECGTPTGSLQIPSYGSSGLKVIFPGAKVDVAAEETTQMVVDFDVAESFGHQTGQGGWVMSPVLKGTVQGAPTEEG